MNDEEIIRFVASFLGGGIVAVILNWLREAWSEESKRRKARLRDQLERLYGPLYFHASQNDDLFGLVKNYHSAYDAEYSSKNWSQSEQTQKNLKKATHATIELANNYVATAVENSAIMGDILRSNYAYIDPEDEEIFRQFVLDQARLKQEFPSEGPMKTPFRIYKRLGEVSFMRPAFSERVRNKFLSKNRELGNKIGS